jgi:hypothetical protein
VFSAVMAMGLSAIFVLVRLNYGDFSPIITIKILSVSLFLICSPQLLLHLSQKFLKKTNQIGLQNEVVWLCLCLLVISVSGWFIPWAKTVIFPLMALFALIAFLHAFQKFLKGGQIFWSFCLLAIALIPFALWVASAIWGINNLNPLYIEKLTTGQSHIDTLFHMSLSNMIKTYGTVTTGLDGVPPINYHFGSHWVFASFSMFIGTHVLHLYKQGYPIIMVPLWFYTFSMLSIRIRYFLYPAKEIKDLRINVWFWLLLLGALVGFLPQQTARGLSIIDSFIISESYLMAAILTFSFFSFALTLFFKIKKKNSLSAFDNSILILIFPIVFWLIGATKISLLFLVIALYYYLFFRLKLYRFIAVDISLVLCTISCWFVYKATVVNFGGDQQFISWFYYVTTYIKAPLRIFFFVFFLFWVWLFIYLRFKELKIGTIGDIFAAFLKKKGLDVECVLVIAIAGLIPMLIIGTVKSSVWYFGDPQRWIALSFVLAILPTNQATKKGKSVVGRIQDIKMVSLVLITIFVVFTTINWFQSIGRISLHNEKLKTRLQDPRYGSRKLMINSLLALDDLPISEKKESLIFIPRFILPYWGLMPNCEKVPFIAPALSGIAMLEGTPDPRTCKVVGPYGYPHYNLKPIHQVRQTLTNKAICAKAQKRGFSKVIAVAPRRAINRKLIHKLNCKLLK